MWDDSPEVPEERDDGVHVHVHARPISLDVGQPSRLLDDGVGAQLDQAARLVLVWGVGGEPPLQVDRLDVLPVLNENVIEL